MATHLEDRVESKELEGGAARATDVKVTHGGLVDRADRVQVLHHFVKRATASRARCLDTWRVYSDM